MHAMCWRIPLCSGELDLHEDHQVRFELHSYLGSWKPYLDGVMHYVRAIADYTLFYKVGVTLELYA